MMSMLNLILLMYFLETSLMSGGTGDRGGDNRYLISLCRQGYCIVTVGLDVLSSRRVMLTCIAIFRYRPFSSGDVLACILT